MIRNFFSESTEKQPCQPENDRRAKGQNLGNIAAKIESRDVQGKNRRVATAHDVPLDANPKSAVVDPVAPHLALAKRRHRVWEPS